MTSSTTLINKFVAAALLAAVVLSPSQARAFDEATLKQIQQMGTVLEVMQGFFKLIDSVHAVAEDPEKSTIYHMHKVQELHEDLGNKANAVPVLRQVLKDTKNPTIRRATYLMLGETLKETGSPEEAIKVFEEGLKESIEEAR